MFYLLKCDSFTVILKSLTHTCIRCFQVSSNTNQANTWVHSQHSFAKLKIHELFFREAAKRSLDPSTSLRFPKILGQVHWSLLPNVVFVKTPSPIRAVFPAALSSPMLRLQAAAGSTRAGTGSTGQSACPGLRLNRAQTPSPAAKGWGRAASGSASGRRTAAPAGAAR